MKGLRFGNAMLGTLVASLLHTALLAPAIAADKKSITFAVIQTQEMSVLGTQWGETLKYIGKQIGADINFYATTSYASVVESMLSGFVDIGKLGPNIYIVANEKSKGQLVPLVATARGPTLFYDQPCACYFGTLITRKGSGFETMGSLKGKTVALVDPASTSGNALPRALFPEAVGVTSLEDFFGKIFYSGSHSASALAVHSGKADAAFVSETTLERVIEQGKMAKDDLNYLWRSPKIMSDVITVNKKSLSDEMIGKLRDAFHGMSMTEEGRKVLKQTGYAAFLIAEDSDFDSLRAILAYEERVKKKN